MKITKVYTKTGDKGLTSLVGGVRISKSDVRLDASGAIDELNSFIGLLQVYVSDTKVTETLTRIQSNLFVVGAHLATDQNVTPLYDSAKLSSNEIVFIEKEIDTMLSELPEKLGFVLPGGGHAGAMAHVCRSVCRRAERCIVGLSSNSIVGDEIIQYVNRLSDYFFVLAKKLNIIDNKAEKIWSKPCK